MTSYADWYLIQYTADLRRREPKNIGVVATDQNDWQLRLFAVDHRNGNINGHALRRFNLLKDDYAKWVEYYRLMIADERLAYIQRSQRHRPTEFRLVSGGHTELRSSLTAFIDNLYEELVDAEHATVTEDRAAVLQSRVERVLQSANIKPTVKPLIQGR